MATYTKIVTLNIRGARDKIPALQSLIHKNNIDIILLQETNFKTLQQAQQYCNTLDITQAVHSIGQQHCRGVSTLCITDKYTLSDTATDTQGRFACATLKNDTTEFNVINIYAPTRKQEEKDFLRKSATEDEHQLHEQKRNISRRL